jgi:hypothetical protein
MTSQAQIVDAARTLQSVWAQDWANTLGPLTQNAELLILGIARGENDIGHSSGFEGTHNWGSLRCFRHDYGCTAHGDLDANGNPVSAQFQKYPSEEEGARGFLNTLLGHHKVVTPIQDGSAHDVAAAMYANGYYTGVHGTGNPDANITDYCRMISNQATAVQSALETAGEPIGTSFFSSTTGSALGATLLLGSIASGAVFLASRYAPYLLKASYWARLLS